MPQKVLVLLSNAYTHDPRVQRQCRTLVQERRAVTVLAWDRSGCDFLKSEVIDGVYVRRFLLHSVPDTGMRQALSLIRFWLWIVAIGFRLDFDVVHCHDLDTVPVGWLIGSLKRKRRIFDAHEHFPSQVKITSNERVANLADRIERFFVPRMDAIITVGERLARYMNDEGAKQVVVVHNSFLRSDFEFDISQLAQKRAELGLSGKTIVVCYLGTFTKTRYIDLLLEAGAQHPDVGLLLAGRGPLESAVRKYAERHDNIVFVGMVSEREVALLTFMSDVIFCCYNPDDPNNYFSMPNKFFQALAASRPCIATRFVGELSEWIEKYEIGLLLEEVTVMEISHALKKLTDPDCIAHYQANARSTFEAQGFGWNASRDRLLALYDQLAKGA